MMWQNKKISVKGRILMTLGILATTTMMTSHAHAVVATSADVAGAQTRIIENTNQQEQSTREQIAQAAVSVIQAIGESSSKATSDQTAMMKYMANTNNTKDQRNVQMAIQTEKLNAINQVTSGASMCNKLTGAATTGELSVLVDLWRKGAMNNLHSYDAGYIDGQGTKIFQPEVLDTAFQSSHCATNATQDDVSMKVCGTVTQKSTPNSARLIDGKTVITTPDDENANLILGQNSLSQDEQDAMGRFMVLIANPHPSASAQVDRATSPEARKKAMLEQAITRARRSVAQSVISGIVAQNSVIKSQAGSIQSRATSWAEDTASNVVGYNKITSSTCSSGGSCYFPNGVSEMDADELTSKSWFYNINWGIFASSQSTSPSLKDLVMMQAWNTVLGFKQYKEMRELNLTLASILAIMLDEQADPTSSQ